MEFVLQKVNYQVVEYCFLFRGIDNAAIIHKEANLKSHPQQNDVIKEHLTGASPRPVLTIEERKEQRKRDKAFIRAMNDFTAKAGLLSDDPFFGGI